MRLVPAAVELQDGLRGCVGIGRDVERVPLGATVAAAAGGVDLRPDQVIINVVHVVDVLGEHAAVVVIIHIGESITEIVTVVSKVIAGRGR